MSDTDVPRSAWGAIDYSALTSRMPVRLTRPITVDDLPRPLPGFRGEIREDLLDPSVYASMSRLVAEQVAAQHRALESLVAIAAARGDMRGIEITRTFDVVDDVYRCRAQMRLSADVPSGEIHYKITGES